MKHTVKLYQITPEAARKAALFTSTTPPRSRIVGIYQDAALPIGAALVRLASGRLVAMQCGVIVRAQV